MLVSCVLISTFVSNQHIRIQRLAFGGKTTTECNESMEWYKEHTLKVWTLSPVQGFTIYNNSDAQDYQKKVTVAEDVLNSHLRRSYDSIRASLPVHHLLPCV